MKRIVAVALLISSTVWASQTGGSGTSQTGGSGHTVVQSLLPPVYLTGDYYLSPSGNDTGNNTCSFAQPCLSINHLQTILTNGVGAVVLLRGGFYFLDAPITLTKSGLDATHPIVYTAYPGETPIITGAKPLVEWTDASSSCAGTAIMHCWKATLSSGFYNFEYLIYVPSGWPASYAVYAMSRRSQSVNTSASYKLNAGPVGIEESCPNDGTHCLDRVYINNGDVSALSYNLNDDRFYHFANWNVDALRLKTYSATKLVFTGPTLAPPQSGFDPSNTGPRYLIVNSLEYFQANATPGTFYIDCGLNTPCSQMNGSPFLPGTATIYYIAKDGENPPTDMILAPQQPQLLVANAPTPPAPGISYLTFEGIVFVSDNFVTPYLGYQSDTGQPNAPAALSFVDTTGIVIDSSIIAHTSGWGLEFKNEDGNVAAASKDNQVINSAIYDVGVSGLRIGRMPPDKFDTGNDNNKATQNTLVRNNLFLGMGRMYPGMPGCIWIGSSHNNTVEYNDCIDSYGGGIGVGPRVNYSGSFAHDNVVQYNNFHDLGEGVIDDFGCVHFANNLNLGNIFQNNICHDITHAVNDGLQGGTGIYVDSFSANLTIRNNLVYRTSGALFFSNGGSTQANNNLVSNNIFAYSYQGPIKRGGGSAGAGDTVLDFTFKHSVVFFDIGQGPQWLNNNGTGYWDCDSQTGPLPPCTQYYAFYSNDYWSPKLARPLFTTTTKGSGATPGTPTSWFLGTSPGQWQSSPSPSFPNDPGEDQTADGYDASIYADPMFVSPSYVGTDFHFRSGPPNNIGFDTTSFNPTYTAGRNKPVFFPPPPSPAFPLQLLSPSQF